MDLDIGLDMDCYCSLLCVFCFYSAAFLPSSFHNTEKRSAENFRQIERLKFIDFFYTVRMSVVIVIQNAILN